MWSSSHTGTLESLIFTLIFFIPVISIMVSFSICAHFYISNIYYRFVNGIMCKLVWNSDILGACVYTCGFEALSSMTKEINCRRAYSFWQEQYFNYVLGKGISPLSLVQIMTLNTEFIFIESSIYLRNYH